MQQYNNQNPTMHSQYSTHSGYAHGGAPSVSSSMMHRRGHSPPPRFRPYMIILMVLFIGLTFIGLVMTIIAVWPGYTPVGGNPLKIAGPILLGVGGAGFIMGIINICYNNDLQKKKDARKEALMYAQSVSRSTIASAHQMQQPTTPTSKQQPSKGILKAPSTSTYSGTKGSDADNDSGMVGQNSFSTGNRSYDRDSDASDASGTVRADNVRVDMNPDPSAQRPAPGKGRSYQNQAYHQETGIDDDIDTTPEQHPSNRRPMQQYANEGFDMYDTSFTGGGALTGQASITGAGMLSPYASPMSAQQHSKPPSQWGQRQPAAMQAKAATPSGRSNQAYVEERHGVSTVSSTYQNMTTPQRPAASRQQYAGPPRGQYAAEAAPVTDSSTEV